MRITKCLRADSIRNEYDYLIGWGNSQYLFERCYRPLHYQIDYMINGEGKNIGDTICGCRIRSTEVLKSIPNGAKILFIIFPNIEQTIIAQIESEMVGRPYDTIIAKLIEKDSYPITYARDDEDILMLEIMDALAISDPFYIDIGVCHPIICNNTFLFYTRGYKNGVLVEPNPDMALLAKEYRAHNRLIQAGGSANTNGEMSYILQKNRPGKSHIKRKGEIVDFASQEEFNVPIIAINDLLAECNARECDILDIDIEGMDYEVLDAIDCKKYPIKVICLERSSRFGKWNFRSLMESKGYVHWATTLENHIYLRKDIFDSVFA